ncbi:MAG: SusC/RagA family TonB-linked outer membrane protein [Bacteroidaceae bacterium]|nr:SusC/RagA family TonB-linked outer membrane protein [Bacteroidaceae bacterium]
MGKKLCLILTLCFLSVGMAFAQKTVNGTVYEEETGEPIMGATIRVDGTSMGATSDVNGNFVIQNVPNSASAVTITYLGMEDLNVAIRPGMKVYMKTDHKQLDEVMVIAYGTAKKSAFTGSAAVVGSEEIDKTQVTNAIDALKGKASGIQINTASGQPGSTPTIRIRGVNSINAGLSPLIVLDGSPFDGDLNQINPIDVESMTVLKDAASSALYGARGGNGVILITTKKGKRGEAAKITVDAKWGSNSKAMPEYKVIKSPAKYYEVWYSGLNRYAQNGLGYTPEEAWKWANDVLIDDNVFGLGYNVYNVPAGQYMIGADGKLNPNATLGNVVTRGGQQYYLTPDDWEDEIYSNALRQEYTVSATGSTDKSNYYASFNYLDNEGIAAASDYKRLTSRLKADYQIKPWLNVEMNAAYSHYNQNALGDDGSSGSSGNAFAFSNIAPIYPMYIRDANGNKIYDPTSRMIRYDYGDGTVTSFRPYLSQANPISANKLNINNTEGNTFNGTGTIKLSLPLGFTVYSINNVYLDEYRGTETTNPFFGQYSDLRGQAYKSHRRTWSVNYQQRVNWNHSFGLNNFDVMIGHEYYNTYGYGLSAYKNNQFSVYNTELNGAVIMGSANSSKSRYNTESWLGRIMYDYDTRYFGSFSLLRQGSSRFDPSDRWGTFWSIGAGWLINKEKWFNAKWVDELKLKMSYGENGNDYIGSYQYIKTYTIVNSNDNVAIVPADHGNPKISWEKNGKFNVGIDFSFWNGRLSGTVEYYNNTTKDMLSWVPFPVTYGWSGQYDNVGNMKNNGIEFDLKGDIIRSRDFTWSAYLNFTTNHNEITKLAEQRKSWYDEIQRYGYSSGSYFYTEGKSRYSYWTKKYAGVDKETGETLFLMNVYEKDENDNDIYYDKKGNKIEDPATFNGEKHRKIIGTTTTTTYNDGDYYICGDMLPDVYGGFGTALKWKGIDFSVDFQYQLGGKVYDGTYAGLMDASAGHALHKDILKAWTETNTNSNVPRFQVEDSYMAAGTDRWLTSASYLSLANITLGYSFPKSVLRAIGLEGLRIYGVADNVWLWSKRQGLDPRQSITGSVTNTYYKPIRTISGGITVTF